MGRILIVDDNSFIRMMLSRSVQDQGHESETAADGRAALELLRRETFDLVLLDVLMPEMDGYQVLEAMMSDPNLQHIPVIMISALEEMDSVIRCIELGAQDYLTKPADPLLLKARINASLARKHLHDMEMRYLKQIEREKKRADDLLNVVIPIGVTLSEERDFGKLLDRILDEAMAFCHAGAGVLHLRTEDDHLRVVTARYNEGEGREDAVKAHLELPPVPLRREKQGDEPEHCPLVACVAWADQAVNIPDTYDQDQFDFSTVHRLDQETGYRSVSILALPLRSGQREVIGVIQLINAKDPQTGATIPFDTHLEQMMTSLATLAGVALENYRRQERLERQIEVLRIEIDEKRDARVVAELTETDFFRQLEAKTDLLRRRLAEAGGKRAPEDKHQAEGL